VARIRVTGANEISLVSLRDVIESDAFLKKTSRLRFALGQDVSGHPIVADLAAMPHLLIAGTTGSGKSVCVNAIICCFLLHNTPDELRFLMVDPKRVELTSYNGIPHLLAPVIVELERVVAALQWVTREMDERYRRFAKVGARNLDDFNSKADGLGEKKLPSWVVVIDELADLMLMAPDETERILTRLAQLSRATGIHLVIATQRPSVDVLTGLIKANFPARISFAVASMVDSRVVLDQPGAERLLGRGDMLFQAPDAPAPVRLQGAYVSEAELVHLVNYWRQSNFARQAQLAELRSELVPEEQVGAGRERAPSAFPPDAHLEQAPLWEESPAKGEGDDALLHQAIHIVRQWRKASTTRLQRHFRIGYTRAARLMDALEERGIIGPPQPGAQPREVIDYGDESPEAGEDEDDEE
jgi:S-DNA-T family DNA segregation ATPase FtsK/SpoIIIE